MATKYYQVIVKEAKDWQSIHDILMQDGTLEDNIPSHSCECVDDKPHSQTRSTYILTDDEVDDLQNHPSILGIGLDPNYHDNVEEPCVPLINRFGKNVRNYRALQTAPGGTPQYHIPATGGTAEINRTGYQILRCEESATTNPWPSTQNSLVKSEDVQYTNDGSDTDCIIADNGVWFGHPEFYSDSNDPVNFRGGNALSRSGECSVLDLVLDAPYYLDPEWFESPGNLDRLEARFDGTLVPKEDKARDWWNSDSNRSSAFKTRNATNWTNGNFGSITVPSDYTRSANCGNRTTPPSNSSSGGHGTPCASLMYGKNYGWAFNANKWSITINLGNTNSIASDEKYYDMAKIFHLAKPTNTKFSSGEKDPTILSNSWGMGWTTLQMGSLSGTYRYKSSDTNVSTTFTSGNAPNFLKTRKGLTEARFLGRENLLTPRLQAGRELVATGGIFFIGAAGNDGRYLAKPSEDNYHNILLTSSQGSTNRYVNRPAYPIQIGHSDNVTDTDPNKTFCIGAIDDQTSGRYSSPAENDGIYSAISDGHETLARNGETGSGVASDYSNKGTGVDFYAPGDGTLAASSNTSTASNGSRLYKNPSADNSGTGDYNDCWMNGTSSACPVAAGLIACALQQNRTWNAEELKNQLNSNIADATNFFLGNEPTDANDTDWITPYSTMGRSVKIIRERSVWSNTPNDSLTTTSGIRSSGSNNERFTITENSSHTHKVTIHGIREFLETDKNSPVELNLNNGSYPISNTGGTAVSYIDEYRWRIKPNSNNQILQFSDSHGDLGTVSGDDRWDDFTIQVTNGSFFFHGFTPYYRLNVSSSTTIGGGTTYNNTTTGGGTGPQTTHSSGPDVDIVKAGPYFVGSGAIKFSDMRTYFKETSSGTVKASQLKRDMANDSYNPIVPNSTENEAITSTTNWKCSQFRGSVKRYWATFKAGRTHEPFRMGRYRGYTSHGLDWSGGGMGGRDDNTRSDGNITRNIQKYVYIRGTGGAKNTTDEPGANLSPAVPARNYRIEVFGYVYGMGGAGGYDSRGFDGSTHHGNESGHKGGMAMRIVHNGNNTSVKIHSGARVWGGGGGGEQGMNGAVPRRGICNKRWTVSGCKSAPACSPGGSISSWSGGCCTYYEFCGGPWENHCNEHCGGNTVYNQCEHNVTSTLPVQGIGGRGGKGQGYDGGRSDGQEGSYPQPPCPQCNSGYTLGGNGTDPGACTTRGGTGGRGGDWGQAGEGTPGNDAGKGAEGGPAGAAICGEIPGYSIVVTGTINSSTVKGSYGRKCDGTGTQPPGVAPVVTLSFNSSNNTLTWTSSVACSHSGCPVQTIWGTSVPYDGTWVPVGTSGSKVVNPNGPTQYTLQMSNAYGAGVASVNTGSSTPSTVWSVTRSGDWSSLIKFDKFSGSGQSSIQGGPLTANGTTNFSPTVSLGAKYRMEFKPGNDGNNWRDDSSDLRAAIGNNNGPHPVWRLQNSKLIQCEDHWDTANQAGGSNAFADLVVAVNAGNFTVDGHTDWPIHFEELHSANNSRASWLAGGNTNVQNTLAFTVTNADNPGQNNWADNPGGMAIRIYNASGQNVWSTRDNVAGTTHGGLAWYKCPHESDWSSFMNEYAVYRAPTNQVHLGTHSYPSKNIALPAGTYFIAWAVDNTGTLTWNGTTHNHGSFQNVKTETVTVTGGSVNNQMIELWDDDGTDWNARFSIVDKGTCDLVRFTDDGRKVRVQGGGNVTFRLQMDDAGRHGYSIQRIKIREHGNKGGYWFRSGETSDMQASVPLCGGDLIYTR